MILMKLFNNWILRLYFSDVLCSILLFPDIKDIIVIDKIKISFVKRHTIRGRFPLFYLDNHQFTEKGQK